MANHKGKQRSVATHTSPVLKRLPLACKDERAAVEFMEAQRWGDTPACPRCGDTDVRQMLDAEGNRNARYLWRCAGCKKQFTVRVGTIMEDSPIPMARWCHAFWRICASKKGVSALQLKREIGCTYKTALFMAHRIRWALAPANAAESKLSGTVEVDETYVGGKPRYRGTRRGPQPDFKDRKTPVVAAVERGGRVKCRVVTDVTPATLKQAVLELVDPSATIHTDDRQSYGPIGKHFAGHESVNHTEREYVRDDVTTNTIEGVFSILKRAVYGTYHAVSRKHLHRYVSEREFVYNLRGVDDGERTAQAIKAADGKRLTYRQQVDG